MVKKPKGWTTTCNRFVAFLDIMGFRDMVFREKHGTVKRMFESLRLTIEDIENDAKKRLFGKSKLPSIIYGEYDISSFVFPVSFSDSIILISNDGSPNSAHAMFASVFWIIAKAMEKGIPMKGAIAYGEFTADLRKSFFFGKPLIDAYDLQNELHLYGIVLHHTCERCLSESKNGNDIKKMYLHQYLVPMKSGKINHYIVDWSNQYFDNSVLLKDITNFYNNVSGTPRLYVDNTLEFVRWVTEKKAKSVTEKPV